MKIRAIITGILLTGFCVMVQGAPPDTAGYPEGGSGRRWSRRNCLLWNYQVNSQWFWVMRLIGSKQRLKNRARGGLGGINLTHELSTQESNQCLMNWFVSSIWKQGVLMFKKVIVSNIRAKWPLNRHCCMSIDLYAGWRLRSRPDQKIKLISLQTE